MRVKAYVRAPIDGRCEWGTRVKTGFWSTRWDQCVAQATTLMLSQGAMWETSIGPHLWVCDEHAQHSHERLTERMRLIAEYDSL